MALKAEYGSILLYKSAICPPFLAQQIEARSRHSVMVMGGFPVMDRVTFLLRTSLTKVSHKSF